jgi:acylphosphatase
VGFRYSTLRAASKFKVNGWVRNKSDGSVELECEGPEKNITDFIKWLENYSRVSRINKQEKPYHGYYKGFSIEY